MRTITATTAFKMPLYGISFPLSACPVSSTVFRNSEKLSCVNEVSASKHPASVAEHDSTPRQEQVSVNKGLLLPDRSLSGRQLHTFSDFQDTEFLYPEKQYQSNFTAAKSSNGLSRIFFDFFQKNVIMLARNG